MKTDEIVNLISIRNYVANSINNFSIKREVVKDLDKTLILLDKILVEELTSDSFKEKINFNQADLALQEVISMRAKK